ncbi:MAG: TIGR02757 family protein [Phocaeicola sp.]
MKTMKEQMNEAFANLNAQEFIANDPIQIVHEMAARPNATIADIEICAIWTAMLAWGRRDQIISNAKQLMKLCNWQPADFVRLGDFYDLPDDMNIHRTIKGKQFKAVNHNLRATYNKVSSVADYLKTNASSVAGLITDLSESLQPARLGSISRNSACKRINMLLRWMVRKDDIDFGLWTKGNIQPSELYAIMDIHVAQQAQKMGLISYPKESWKAVLELTHVYRSWDAADPLKYDFVLMTNDFRK